ncbi:MAG: LysR family transcriptional regulator [Lachnospiraceae bacterium]|nr:LysR family transcriptional regulator [Lachnospiraceae bacterium]
MDLKVLRYFTCVAVEGNFTRAAEKLMMSQPPLSTAIKELEQELHVTLFIRGKRKVTLTEAGRFLLNRAGQILELADKTELEMATFDNHLTGLISLAMVDGMAPHLAAKWISGFLEEYPRINFELWNGSSDDIIDRLRRGLADVAIVAAPYNAEELDGLVVGREPWTALMSRDHPLALETENEIPLKKLAGERLIIPQRKSRVDAISSWFKEAGEEMNAVCTLSSYEDAVAMAEQNVGICIFPQTTRDTGRRVTTRVITEPEKYAEYVLVRPKKRTAVSVADEFINYVEDMTMSGVFQVEPRSGKLL